MVLERPPGAPAAGLETNPAEHEGPVISVLELVLRVDPAGDADIRLAARGGDGIGLRDRDRRCGGEEPTDPEGGAEGAEDEAAGKEGDETRGADEKGSHGPDDSRRPGPGHRTSGSKRPEGTYSRRGR